MEFDSLNRLYHETVAAIREIDPDHIIFLEASHPEQDYEKLDPPFAPNLVYSPHYYNPAAIRPGSWPMEVDGVLQDRAQIERDTDWRDGWILRHNAPVWIGEFGVRRYDSLPDKDSVLREILDCYEKRGHSWCYWSFKDFELRGPLYIDPKSAWAEFTRPIRMLKLKYHADRSHTDLKPWRYDQFLEDWEEGDFECSREALEMKLDRNLRDTLADQLTLTFARQFAALTFDEIDALTDSFRFENCRIYEPWAEIFREYGEK